MAVFEVEANGKTFEVEAPDIKTAAQHAQRFAGQAPQSPPMSSSEAVRDRAPAKPDTTYGPDAPTNLVSWLRQYHQDSKKMMTEGGKGEMLPDVARKANSYTPGLPAALSMLIPGSGLTGTAMRGLGVGAAQGGEAALEGRNPLPEGVGGAAVQVGAEMLPKVAKGALMATPVLGTNMAMRAQTHAINRAVDAMSKSQAAAAPGEYMGMYIPTGIPRKMGTVGFQPNSAPYTPPTPAVEPQMVPHKALEGWTLKDVLNQVGPAARGAAKMDPARVLLRLLGASGEETQSRLTNE